MSLPARVIIGVVAWVDVIASEGYYWSGSVGGCHCQRGLLLEW